MSRGSGSGRRSLIVASQAGIGPLLLAALLWLGMPGAQSVLAAPGPPPTPVPPRGSPSPFLQKLDDAGRTLQPPPLGAKAVVLADLDTGQVLYGVRADDRRAIASLTKVMTGLLTIEETDPDEQVTISAEAAPPANLFGLSALGLKAGETLSVKQLTYALLMQSANDAAVALAEHISGSEAAFEKLMNRRAAQLGMQDTRFASPNGLDDDGFSSASDLAILTQAAMAEPEFARISRTKFHTVPGGKGAPARKIQNRNVLLWLYPGTTGAKTGFTSKAGYCLIATAQRGERRLVVVVLGAQGEAFSDAAELLTYGFKGFAPEVIVEAGEDLGERKVGESMVALRAGETLELYLPRKGPQPPERIVIDPAAAGAIPTPGAVVGEIRVGRGSAILGAVPVIAAGNPGGTAADPSAEDLARRVAEELMTTIRQGGFVGVL